MKLRMSRTLFRGHETLEQGQIVDVPDDQAQWWMDREYAEPLPPNNRPYETKPYPARPMLAGGEVKPSSASPPARRSRRRKSKPAGEDAQ